MRSEFDRDLHTMHKELMGMGASCERAIALAVSSITDSKPGLKDEVQAAEEDIDRAERNIEAPVSYTHLFEEFGTSCYINHEKWWMYSRCTAMILLR